jgi:hypothetical protein
VLRKEHAIGANQRLRRGFSDALEPNEKRKRRNSLQGGRIPILGVLSGKNGIQCRKAARQADTTAAAGAQQRFADSTRNSPILVRSAGPPDKEKEHGATEQGKQSLYAQLSE